MSILTLSFSLVFLGALYSVVMLAIVSIQRLAYRRGDVLATIERRDRGWDDPRGMLAAALGALALFAELILYVLVALLGEYVGLLWVPLLPVAAGAAILAAIISSLRGLSGLRGWSYVGLAAATVTLVSLSVGMISPFLSSMR